MGNSRLHMARIKEILRLKFEKELTHRQVALSLSVSAGCVGSLVSRAKNAGITLEDVLSQNESTLERRIYGDRTKNGERSTLPSGQWIHDELKRPGVTRELLHLEYLKEHPDGCSYTTFCKHYRKWKIRASPSMRQMHRAGEKLFVDYSGKRPQVVDRATGEARYVELFVATLGASNKTFVVATESQKLPDWLSAHVLALEYFGGVPEILVPDQLKSGVRASSAYEPLTNRSYGDCARHYGAVVIPARPLKPKDKSKVEVAVQIAQRWILAKIRNETFFDLASLNERLAELLEELNNRPMKKRGAESRNELFNRIERKSLKKLPRNRYEYGEWKHARVNVDYHVSFDNELILNDRPHPEMGYRSCLGIQALERKYGGQRVELASKRCVELGVRSYRHMSSMLKNGLENSETESDELAGEIPEHEIVRGSQYYH